MTKEVSIVGEPQYAQLGPWTICEVTDGDRKGYGASKKSKLDRMNDELGRRIALGRAIKDLVNKVHNKKRSQNIFVG